MDYLSDVEKSQIEKFVGNVKMFEAVRKVLLAGIYENGVLKADQPHDASKNFALTQVFTALINGHPISDEDIGQNIRAQAAGIRLIETGFKKLSDLKEVADAETEAKNGGKKGKEPNRAL